MQLEGAQVYWLGCRYYNFPVNVSVNTAQLLYKFALAGAGGGFDCTCSCHAVVEVVTTPGFYSNSGRVSEVERNERKSEGWMDGWMDGWPASVL